MLPAPPSLVADPAIPRGVPLVCVSLGWLRVFCPGDLGSHLPRSHLPPIVAISGDHYPSESRILRCGASGELVWRFARVGAWVQHGHPPSWSRIKQHRGYESIMRATPAARIDITSPDPISCLRKLPKCTSNAPRCGLRFAKRPTHRFSTEHEASAVAPAHCFSAVGMGRSAGLSTLARYCSLGCFWGYTELGCGRKPWLLFSSFPVPVEWRWRVRKCGL